MNELLNIIAQIVFELPPDRLCLIVEKIEGLATVKEINKIKRNWGANFFDEQLYRSFIDALRKVPNMTGHELSIAFQAAMASVTHGNNIRGRAELLWTGPQTYTSPVRYTEQALCELIDSASKSIFIVSFVVCKADNVVNALFNAIKRDVHLCFLLEASQENGGTISSDSFAELKKHLPQAVFYMWDNSMKQKKAAVHAKCAVADDSVALVTSANLTGKAMEDNMEMGVLMKGGDLPRQLSAHLNALVNEKIIIPYANAK